MIQMAFSGGKNSNVIHKHSQKKDNMYKIMEICKVDAPPTPMLAGLYFQNEHLKNKTQQDLGLKW